MFRRGVRVGALLLTFALAGCGGSSSSTRAPSPPTTAAPSGYLNSAHIAFAIEQSITRQRHIKARVTCPTRIPKQRGRKFICVATSSSGQTPFVVTEVNDAGDVRYVGR